MKKNLYRFVLKPILILIGSIALYIIAAYTLPNITFQAEDAKNKDIAIYILSNGVHTDIVVPARHPLKDWTKTITYQNTVAKDSSRQFLAMGWGDKGFYLETPTWAELQPSVAFKAAFGLSGTAMHIEYHKTISESNLCKKVMINTDQYKRLIAYIEESFQLSNEKVMLIPNFSYGENDTFYEATGRYSLLKTCNAWTNNGLKIAGQKHCLWTPFDKGILALFP